MISEGIPLSNVLVVNGTCHNGNFGSFQNESIEVMDAIWGNEWLDYFNVRQGTIEETAQRWARNQPPSGMGFKTPWEI